jgi:pimeloyl-ACP methyl ester carboxylesterase
VLTGADVILGGPVAVAEHTIELAGSPVYYRGTPTGDVTPLYLHSVPTSSDDWTAFLQRTGGLAPDLPGFGRSGKAGSLDYSLPAYVAFLEAFLRSAGANEVTAVGHGWGGAIALAFAQRHPDRVRRLVLIDAVPLLEDFRWPALIRRLRSPILGELLMGSVNRRWLARSLRSGAASAGAWDEQRLDSVWAQFDQGTQRAILRLHRSIDPAGLAAAGSGLEGLAAPGLVVWGEADPWLDSAYARVYAQRLGAELALITGGGHWPWLDRPEVIDRVVGFVGGASDPARPGGIPAPPPG